MLEQVINGEKTKNNLLAFSTEILAFTDLPEFVSINFSTGIREIKE